MTAISRDDYKSIALDSVRQRTDEQRSEGLWVRLRRWKIKYLVVGFNIQLDFLAGQGTDSRQMQGGRSVITTVASNINAANDGTHLISILKENVVKDRK